MKEQTPNSKKSFLERVKTWKFWAIPKKPKIRKVFNRISYRQPEGYCEEPLTAEGHKPLKPIKEME